jgi:hypothetical protein
MGIRKLTLTRGSFQRTASADLFRHTLSRIPSQFGRLLYLGSLRDPHSGSYRHYGLSAAYGREQSEQALRLSHNRTFREFLRMPVKEKHADLLEYLESLEDPKGRVVRFWLESRGYLANVPDAASRADRALYASDVEHVLEAIRAGDGESRAPGSLRRR